MGEILGQLGIHWKLLLSQGVNFFIVLGILTYFVWRPLLKVIAERKHEIEGGLAHAKEIESRLRDIEKEREEKSVIAERRAIEIIGEAEKKAEARFSDIVTAAEKKAEETVALGVVQLEQKRQEELSRLTSEANSLIRNAISKAVSADPHTIEEKLIANAEANLKKEIKS